MFMFSPRFHPVAKQNSPTTQNQVWKMNPNKQKTQTNIFGEVHVTFGERWTWH